MVAHGQWAPDLIALGYGDPLPAPALAVQATLVSLKAPEIHEFIKEQDTAALLDRDDEGEHAPLLLSTLDLSQWTLILNLTIRESAAKAFEQLRLAHSQLADILEWENDELIQAEKDALAVDAAIKAANPHETSNSVSSLSGPSAASNHPFLNGLNVGAAQKAALEDLVENIHTSQTEKDLALLLATGKGPVVPFTPSRSVEALVATKAHRCWGLTNINLLAPISVPMWRTWTNMSPVEVETLKSNAINGTGLLREGQPIPGAFPLSLFDHHKCSSSEVRILTKQSLNTNYGRSEKYSTAIWNCQRPYFRCTCKPDSSKGCRGDVMWFDHAIWYMVNNLHVFFDNAYPTLSAKFAAFVIWLSEAARVAVRHQIVFHYIRDLMVEASIQFTSDPSAKLLANHPSGAGVRLVERLIKPASFSAANPLTSGSNNPGKRPRSSINCNVLPEQLDDSQRLTTPRSAPRSFARGGRGGYNRKYRPAPHSALQARGPSVRGGLHGRSGGSHGYNPNEAFVFTGPAYRANSYQQTAMQISPMDSRQAQSRPPTSASSLLQVHSPSPSGNEATSSIKTATRFDRSSMKGRVLDWDSV